jgi:hypothetical protein
MTQLGECLLGKCKALSTNPGTTKTLKHFKKIKTSELKFAINENLKSEVESFHNRLE